MRRTKSIGVMCTRGLKAARHENFKGAFQEHWVKTFVGDANWRRANFLLGPGRRFQGPDRRPHSFSMAPVPPSSCCLHAAAERIWFTNAYCTPTDGQVDLLIKAVQRHVDVRLLLPGPNNDQPLTKSAGRAAYGRMLEGGVKIFEYQPTMIHVKAMVVDGLFSMVGSSNFDARSSEINEGLDLVVYDQNFGHEMEGMFERFGPIAANNGIKASSGRRRGGFSLFPVVLGGGLKKECR